MKQIKDIFWNSIGSALFAGQAAIVLIFISRFYSNNYAGIVTYGYAYSILLLTISKYGIRNYQASDLNERFSFKNYLFNRCFTTAIVIFMAIVELLFEYHHDGVYANKVILIFLILILKMIDGIEDVFLGRLQQLGKFIIGAKIMAVHQLLVMVFLCALCIMKVELKLVYLAADGFSLLILVVLVIICWAKLDFSNEEKNNYYVCLPLLVECFPICLGIALSNYIGNIPKYVINQYSNEETQAVFGYIMLPVFVITLINQFMFQPFVRDLAVVWENNERKLFLKKIFKQCAFVVGILIIVLVVSFAGGLQILSKLYSTNLMPYKMEFFLLLLGGTIYALSYYLTIPLVIVRKQNIFAAINLIGVLFVQLIGKICVERYATIGISLVYLGINLMIFVFLGVGLLVCIWKSNKI